MTRTLALILALAVPAGAFASSDSGVDSAKAHAARSMLQAQGYEVRKVDMEDGMIEVYVLKDGKRLELYLDNDLNVVRTKTDD